MEWLAYQDITIHEGLLMQRVLRNMNRLAAESYQSPAVFQPVGYEWPGDWEGRTILALTKLSQASGQEAAYLSDIMKALPAYLNERGYFGTIHPSGVVDEQQLSGHSWLLRAMIEHYMWKKDETSYQVIHSIVNHLLLPARGSYRDYPVEPGLRTNVGEAIGSVITETSGKWRLSTDVGCAFIMLDGASQAYQLLMLPELKELIIEMIEKFLSIDIIQLDFQTHATLSALRGILRFCEITGDRDLLSQAERLYSLYYAEGMTENYANYNWFNKPEWTEPCAVIDSFIAGMELWKQTSNTIYLETAHHIFYNAIGYGQRPNGGFGCDTCSGAKDVFLSPASEGLFEASWCCTMRGGEGLSRAVQFTAIQEQEGIIIPFYHNVLARVNYGEEILQLKVNTSYPYTGHVQIAVMESNITSSKYLKLYIPTWVDQQTIMLHRDGVASGVEFDEQGFLFIPNIGIDGTEIKLTFDIPFLKQSMLNKHSMTGFHTYRHGVVQLGINQPDSVTMVAETDEWDYVNEAVYKLRGTDIILSPIMDMFNMSEQEALVNKKQLLFHSIT